MPTNAVGEWAAEGDRVMARARVVRPGAATGVAEDAGIAADESAAGRTHMPLDTSDGQLAPISVIR